MKHSHISKETWRNWENHVTQAANPLGILSALIDLSDLILKDLRAEPTPNFPHMLEFVREQLIKHTWHTEVQYAHHEGEVISDEGEHIDHVRPHVEKLIRLTCPWDSYLNGANGKEREYEFSHPAVVLVVDQVANILNKSRNVFLFRCDDAFWSDAYEEARFHGSVKSASDDGDRVEILLDSTGRERLRRHASREYFGRKTLRAYSGRHMRLEYVEASESEVLVAGRYI